MKSWIRPCVHELLPNYLFTRLLMRKRFDAVSIFASPKRMTRIDKEWQRMTTQSIYTLPEHHIPLFEAKVHMLNPFKNNSCCMVSTSFSTKMTFFKYFLKTSMKCVKTECISWQKLHCWCDMHHKSMVPSLFRWQV